MHSVDDELIDLWWAYYKLEPWGNSWMQSVHIAEQLSLNTAWVAASAGQKQKVFSWKDFMPTSFYQEKPKQKKKRPALFPSGEDLFGQLKKVFRK